jgi:hypothetical protein
MLKQRPLLGILLLALGGPIANVSVPAQNRSLASAAAWRPLAFVRDGSLVLVTAPDQEEPRVLFQARQQGPRQLAVSAFAWSPSGDTIYLGVGLEIWRVAVAGRDSTRIAVLHDRHQTLIGDIKVLADSHTLLIRAIDDPSFGSMAFVDSSFYHVDVRTGRGSRLSEARYGRLAGWGTDDTEPSPRSPSGQWTYRLEPSVSYRLNATSTPLGIYDAATGQRQLVFDPLELELERDPKLLAWMGRAVVIGWSATSNTLLVVSCIDCVDTCGGRLYALDPQARRVWPVTDSTIECDTEWSGPLLLLEEGHIVVIDTTVWRRWDLGVGEWPKWQPKMAPN